MDAYVKEHAPTEGEEDTQEQESRILQTKENCALTKICATAGPLGINCQQVFERAYLHAGHSATFSRAVFAMYLSFKGMGPIPLPVQEYLKHVAEQGYKRSGGNLGFCAGCMLDEVGKAGFMTAYDLVCSVTRSKADICGSGILSTTDSLYLDLLDSGALEQESEVWESLLDMDFEDPEEKE